MAGHLACEQRAGFLSFALISEWPVFQMVGLPPWRSIHGASSRVLFTSVDDLGPGLAAEHVLRQSISWRYG